jgi:protein-tyrosine kinase
MKRRAGGAHRPITSQCAPPILSTTDFASPRLNGGLMDTTLDNRDLRPRGASTSAPYSGSHGPGPDGDMLDDPRDDPRDETAAGSVETALVPADAPADDDGGDRSLVETASQDGASAPATTGDPASPPAAPDLVNVSHRFLGGLLPNREPRSYLLSPPNLLTRRAEDFRQVRAQIKQHLGDHGVILVASARHGEGRSITALNLGLAFAQEYERVVYVEADLRRPALHAFFEIEQGRGLARLLRRRDPIGESLGDELFPTDVPGFYLLPAGVRAGPPEVFASPRLPEVIGRLREEADWAIIDAAPMLTYAEPLTLAKLVDGVVVVALEGRTRDDDITRLAERLKGANATVLGAAYLHRS